MNGTHTRILRRTRTGRGPALRSAWRKKLSSRIPEGGGPSHHQFDGARREHRRLPDRLSRPILVDEFGFRYPGIKKVEHVYFHAVHGADDATRRGYLDQAHRLGREF